jgi:nucleotide-binding universal stress UspA family protein
MAPLLVFADDRSPGSDAAWAWVCAQEWPGWRVHVVTVERLGVSHRDPQPARQWTPSPPRSAPSGAAITEVVHLITDGDPRKVLAEMDADLLVVGPRGTGFMKSLHIGSVAEALLDCPAAPLLIAKDDTPARTILLASDGSRHSMQAAKVLAAMPWIGAARVTIVGVDEGDGGATHAVSVAAEILAGCAHAVDQRTIAHDPLTLTVNVRQELEGYIAEHACDLVVAGTKGLSGIPRARLGSVANYLAHHVHCPVLLVRDAEHD